MNASDGSRGVLYVVVCAAPAVAFGDAGTAVETGETLDLQHLPAGLGGRRSQVSLDLARAYAQQRHDAAAVT